MLLHLSVICASLCGVAPWLLGRPAPHQMTPRQARPAPVTYRDFDSARAMRTARHLALSIGPRPGGSAGERAAAEWLSGQLRGMGYDVRRRSGIRLGGRGLKTQNVIATLPGRSQGPRLLIGAHMDTYPRPGCTGANDNASGVAVTLELARLLARARVPYSFEIVFFGAEESQARRSLVGSGAFVAAAAAKGALPRAMICVDMVGRGERLHLWHDGGGNGRLIGLCQRSARAMGVELRAGRRSGGSDHVLFAAAGVPAVWLQRLPDSAQHTPADRAERLQEEALAETGRLLAHVLLRAPAADQWH